MNPLFFLLGVVAAIYLGTRSRSAGRGVAAHPGRAPSSVTSASRVALIGDSYAVGLGPILAQLAAADAVTFRHEGHVGTRARQWATRDHACGECGEWLASMRPTHVLISLGMNDIGASNIATEAPFYRQLADNARRLGAKVIWLHPPNVTKPQLAAIRDVIDRLGVETFHTERLDLPLSGIHPTQAGYASWADALWRHLRG